MSPLAVAILLLTAAYLVGAIPFGYLIGRLRGVSLFEAGSGNIGATNAARVLGRRTGALVFLLDFLKGAVPVAVSVPLARALARQLGSPLPSTSANLSGEPAPSDSAALHPDLLDGADLLLDAGALPPSPPSTLVQVTEASWRLLRAGVVPVADLTSLLGPPEAPVNGPD